MFQCLLQSIPVGAIPSVMGSPSLKSLVLVTALAIDGFVKFTVYLRKISTFSFEHC